MADETQDQEGIRARSEQAIGELAQALIDSEVLENALAAAFGAREKAADAQRAALSALNLPSAAEVERLERRIRSLSRRLEEVEDQLDGLGRDVAEMPPRDQRRKDPRLTLYFRLRVRLGGPAGPFRGRLELGVVEPLAAGLGDDQDGRRREPQLPSPGEDGDRLHVGGLGVAGSVGPVHRVEVEAGDPGRPRSRRG